MVSKCILNCAVKIRFSASVLLQTNPPIYYEGFKARLRCKLMFDSILLFYSFLLSITPNIFISETAIFMWS